MKKITCSFPDKPIVRVNFGPTLNPDLISEGDDVYFECHVTAFPSVFKMAWSREVRVCFPQGYAPRVKIDR